MENLIIRQGVTVEIYEFTDNRIKADICTEWTDLPYGECAKRGIPKFSTETKVFNTSNMEYVKKQLKQNY